MNKLKLIIPFLLAIIIVSGMAVGGCASEGDEVKPLKIGKLNSFTGDLSDFGAAHRNAGQLAADHINLAGGVQGVPIAIVARDTATNPVQGVDSARALVDIERVVAIVGALSSGVSIAVAESVTGPSQILQISAASTSPAITVLSDGDFLFRTTVSDAVQGVIMGRLARELLHFRGGFVQVAAIHIAKRNRLRLARLNGSAKNVHSPPTAADQGGSVFLVFLGAVYCRGRQRCARRCRRRQEPAACNAHRNLLSLVRGLTGILISRANQE